MSDKPKVPSQQKIARLVVPAKPSDGQLGAPTRPAPMRPVDSAPSPKPTPPAPEK